MKKLNNQGFAISTILFSILILGSLVFGVLYSTLTNSKSCPNGCCEPPCEMPKKEEINPDPCPNEFAIGTEHFCPLYMDNNYVVALAKYNLNIGQKKDDDIEEGLQSVKTKQYMVGYVPAMTSATVSGTNYGYYDLLVRNSNVAKYNSHVLTDVNNISNGIADPIRGYIRDYESKLNNLGMTNINVRLLNIDDVSDESNFKNCKDPHGKRIIDYLNTGDHDNNAFYCSITDDKKWIFWTNSWLGITDKSTETSLYGLYVDSGGFSKSIGAHYSDVAGVRPVIEITRSDYNKLPKA